MSQAADPGPGAALALFVLGLLVHGAWALTVPGPLDWDAAYYRDVALSIAASRGAQAGAAWTAGLAVGPLPMPADLHWMPLPSRVLVPGLAVWPSRGDQLITVILAALWAPVSAALAAALGGGARARWSAGLIAVAAGGYARFLSTPDVFALQGLIGGLGWLSVWRGRAGAAAGWAAAAALCRGDGFLLGLAWGAALGGPAGAGVAFAGLAATAGWGLRNLQIAPELALGLRQAALTAPSMADLLAGEARPITLSERVATLGRELPQALVTAFVAGAALLPGLSALGAWAHRADRRLWAALAYLVGMPCITLFLTPAIAASGTPFRSGAALFPLAAALGAVGLIRLDDWLVERRAWRPQVISIGAVVGFWAVSLALGLAQRQARPAAPVDCRPLAGLPAEAVVLSGRPLLLRAVCGPAAAWLGRTEAAESVAARAAAVGATHALLPPTDPDPSVPISADAPALLPGWRPLGGGLFAAP